MKFLKWLVSYILIGTLVIAIFAENADLQIAIILVSVAWFVFLIVMHYFQRKKLPGGIKGARLQGIWVLEKHLKFEPVLKKWEVVPVEEKKNYFEFNGSNFCSGDFDEDHQQLPADYSPFSVDGENMILESEFFKKANWKWEIKRGCLELTGETPSPQYSKSQFIFYKKNWH